MRVLLLVPPADKLYLRDYYCSESTKADYCWAPLDLLVLSGILAKEHFVKVLDANVLKLSKNEALDRVLLVKPEVVIFLTGAASLRNDLEFVKLVKEKTDCLLFATGDIFFFKPLTMQNYSFVDGALLDFTSDSIVKFLKGERKNLTDIAYRDGNQIVLTQRSASKDFSYPVPKHELFPLSNYSFPYSRFTKITSIISNFGCPYKCKFCPSGMIGYKERNLDEFAEELKYISSLGIKEVLIHDFTFGPYKARIMELCNKLMAANLNLVWSAKIRTDTVDEETLKLMKKAGCYLVMVGVEAADQKTLDATNKNITHDNTNKLFKLCSKLGILTLAHFIIGFPWETREDIERTIKLSREIDCDYASFNLFVPRVGTLLRNDMLGDGSIGEDDLVVDVSADIRGTKHISKEEMARLYKKAVFGFYLRPKQILRITKRTPLRLLVKNGLSVLKITGGMR